MHRPVIFFFVLYGSKSWYLKLTEVHKTRLRKFERKVQIFGIKREKATESWRTLLE
jgi:hypothetical protein